MPPKVRPSRLTLGGGFMAKKVKKYLRVEGLALFDAASNVGPSVICCRGICVLRAVGRAERAVSGAVRRG